MTSLPLDELTAEVTSAGAVVALAVLQGVCEFLPISSSGHLVLGRSVLDLGEVGLAFDVALHLGTLFAVLWAYRQDVRSLIGDFFQGRLGMLLWLVVASAPVGLAGVLVEPQLEMAAQSTVVASCGLLVTAAFLLVGDRARRGQAPAPSAEGPGVGGALEVPAMRLAILLGLAQMLAICPGISRSGTTIAAGLVLGLPVLQAARLSFLMSIPAVAGAAVFKLPGALADGIGGLPTGLVLASIAISAIVGLGSLRVLLVVTARGAFPWFAGYCALAGFLSLAML